MLVLTFPIIDRAATGQNILRLRQKRGLSVRELQEYLGFENPRSIYQWQSGQRLASIAHLYALSYLLDASIEDILVCVTGQLILPGVESRLMQQIVFCRLLWSSSAQAFIPCRLTIPFITGI